jgi:hypothetical protein
MVEWKIHFTWIQKVQVPGQIVPSNWALNKSLILDKMTLKANLKIKECDSMQLCDTHCNIHVCEGEFAKKKRLARLINELTSYLI